MQKDLLDQVGYIAENFFVSEKLNSRSGVSNPCFNQYLSIVKSPFVDISRAEPAAFTKNIIAYKFLF